MNNSPTFSAQLKEITHEVFMVSTWLFTAITLFVLVLALYRLVPKRADHRIATRPFEEN